MGKACCGDCSCSCIEHGLEIGFEKIGKCISRYPWLCIFGSILVTAGLGVGYILLENETRPEKQWIPLGAPSLDQNDYIKATWPSSRRFNFYIATCQDKPRDQCNMFESKYIKQLYLLQKKISEIVINGDKIVQQYDNDNPKAQDRPWTKYAGNWTFDTIQLQKNLPNNEFNAKGKCFKFGPFCAEQSIINVFGSDDYVIQQELTDQMALTAINAWEKQETPCPLTLARTDSPCINTTAYWPQAATSDCRYYQTSNQRSNCRSAATNYCKDYCEMVETLVPPVAIPGQTQRIVVIPKGLCRDYGCIQVGTLGTLETNVSNNSSNDNVDRQSRFSAFKISSVASSGLGGPVTQQGKYKSAVAVFGFYALRTDNVVVDRDEKDLLSKEWEKEALCIFGIKADPKDGRACKRDDIVSINAQFARSLGDEFGANIQGDLGGLGAAYAIVFIYTAVNLAPCGDVVFSMVGMSIVTIVVVLMSYGCAMGMGGYLGIPNNNLNSNIPFLLLGLGVDDAFVLVREFTLVTSRMGEMSIPDRIIETTKRGGVSILITSLTDALAFLVGSATVLPALSWFCQFAGFGVIYCFLFQLFFVLPCIQINARRESQDRIDVLCCFKRSKCCPKKEKEKKCCRFSLEICMRNFAQKLTTLPGKIVTLLIFTLMFAMGIAGCCLIYKDFKLEWFIPDDSYLNNFLQLNEEYFASGVPFTVYTKDADFFKEQTAMDTLGKYLNTSQYCDTGETVNDWYTGFTGSLNRTEANQFIYTDQSMFYSDLHKWYKSADGASFRTNIKWVDGDCDDVDSTTCNQDLGIRDSRLQATIKLEMTTTGTDRYATMIGLRDDISNILPNAFPFSPQFLFWEEVGVIDGELIRNLIICGAVIICVVFFMIPIPRIALCVILCITLSVVEVLGFMYWWGVTISGTSTVYILISVGLAVDYSAHIAHMFVLSKGKADERVIQGLERVGPPVFHAVMSTFLAVILIGFSKSYVFRVFFKAMFLVTTIGGAHGLWLLPALLSIFGGDDLGNSTGHTVVKEKKNRY